MSSGKEPILQLSSASAPHAEQQAPHGPCLSELGVCRLPVLNEGAKTGNKHDDASYVPTSTVCKVLLGDGGYEHLRSGGQVNWAVPTSKADKGLLHTFLLHGYAIPTACCWKSQLKAAELDILPASPSHVQPNQST